MAGNLEQYEQAYDAVLSQWPVPVDVICDHGRSTASGTPVDSLPKLMAWLDTVFDGLSISEAALCGHSYGAWLALQAAGRVT